MLQKPVRNLVRLIFKKRGAIPRFHHPRVLSSTPEVHRIFLVVSKSVTLSIKYVETPCKFIIAEINRASIQSRHFMYKKGRVNLNSRIISTDEDPSLRIESSAIINLCGVSTKLNKYKFRASTIPGNVLGHSTAPISWGVGPILMA